MTVYKTGLINCLPHKDDKKLSSDLRSTLIRSYPSSKCLLVLLVLEACRRVHVLIQTSSEALSKLALCLCVLVCELVS